MRFLRRALLVMPFITILLVLTSGCALVDKFNALFAEPPLTSTDFLPQESALVLQFSTLNQEEAANLEKIAGFFPQKEKGLLESSLTRDFTFYNLDYVKDLKPVLGEKTETVLGLEGDADKNSEQEVYLIQKIASQEAYDQLINKLKTNQKITELTESAGYVLTTPNQEKLFFTQKENFIVATNTSENLQKVLNLPEEERLSQSKTYQLAQKKIKTDGLVNFYVNTEKIVELFQAEDEKTGTGATPLIAFVGGSVSTRADGFQFDGYAQGNTEKLTELKMLFNEIPNQKTYLDQKLPGEKVFLYLEEFDLKTFLKNFEKQLTAEDAKIYQQQKEQISQTLNLDFETQILSFLNKAFAVSLQSGGSSLPNLTLAVDVSNDPENAAKLMNTLDGFLQVAKLSFPEYAKAFEQIEIKISAQNFQQIKLVEANLPAELKENGALVLNLIQDFQVIYGITDDQVLIFSTYPNFAEEYNKIILAEEPNYKELKTKLAANGQGVLYFSPKILFTDFNELMQMMARFSPNTDLMQAQSLEPYFTPCQGIMFGVVADSASYQTKGYLKLEK